LHIVVPTAQRLLWTLPAWLSSTEALPHSWVEMEEQLKWIRLWASYVY